MSSTKTATATKPSGTSATPSVRNPKDSMKSTWRADRSQWGIPHWIIETWGLSPTNLDKEVPVHAKTDKVPAVPDWQPHVWIILNSAPTVIFHQAWTYYTGHNLGFIATFFLYAASFQAIGAIQFHQMCRIGHRYGFLDGDKHERDNIPDHAVGKVFLSLELTAILRAAMLVLCSYNPAQAPLDAKWWLLPLEAGLYPIILDFWFYWYHRIMHESEYLWQFHRTHHLTKHPNALLTLYADHEQEFFDIVGIPLATYLTLKLFGFPMGFYEWWLGMQYVTFSELSGHSGLRIHASPPNTLSWLLKYFKSELVIEDHDLHHRRGWKKSGNYGKQTRLWDRIFGTFIERIESRPDNIDYVNTAEITLL